MKEVERRIVAATSGPLDAAAVASSSSGGQQQQHQAAGALLFVSGSHPVRSLPGVRR